MTHEVAQTALLSVAVFFLGGISLQLTLIHDRLVDIHITLKRNAP